MASFTRAAQKYIVCKRAIDARVKRREPLLIKIGIPIVWVVIIIGALFEIVHQTPLMEGLGIYLSAFAILNHFLYTEISPFVTVHKFKQICEDDDEISEYEARWLQTAICKDAIFVNTVTFSLFVVSFLISFVNFIF